MAGLFLAGLTLFLSFMGIVCLVFGVMVFILITSLFSTKKTSKLP